MPLTPNFTVSQTQGEPSKINFTDTSSGSDVTITQRRIYAQKANGGFLVETGTATEYEEWGDFPTTTDITLDLMDKDYALVLTVQWLTALGVVVYDKVFLWGFTLYNEEFDYQLTQRLSGNPLLINDNNFYTNKSDLRTNIDSGNQAISQASDQFGAQQCYDAGTKIRTDSPYSFNANPDT